MPTPSFNRPVRCSVKKCSRILEKGEARMSYTAGLSHRGIIPICPKHFMAFDRVNRVRFWRHNHVPEVRSAIVADDSLVNAYYTLKDDVVYVTQRFAALESEQMVYVLSHEAIHRVLSCYFGLMTSAAFDIIYKRSLRALGGHSLHTWMLNDLYNQTDWLSGETVEHKSLLRKLAKV